jgi:predicted PurR-regulated permease PerM
MMLGQRETTVNITNRTIVRGILLVVAAVLAYKFIGQLSHVLTLVFISFFLALAVNPVVSWLTHRLKIGSRVRATAVAYLMTVALLAGFLLLTVPPIVNQTRDFISDAPRIVADFQNQNSSIARAADRYNIDQRLTEAAKSFASNYSNFGSTILDTTKRVISGIVSVIAVLVMTFMMLVEGPRWKALVIGNLPKKDKPRYERLAHKMSRTVSGFVIGQLILSVAAGTFALIALLVVSNILDVSINAVALAAIVAIFGLIPMIGNPISAILVTLVCLLSSVELAAIMLIYFIIYQQVENVTLQPYIQSRQNELTPLLVFVAALIGISLAGIVGAFAAIPVAACIKILLEDRFGEQLPGLSPKKTA